MAKGVRTDSYSIGADVDDNGDSVAELLNTQYVGGDDTWNEISTNSIAD